VHRPDGRHGPGQPGAPGAVLSALRYCEVRGRTGETCTDSKCLPCFAQRCWEISIKYDDPTLMCYMHSVVREAEDKRGDLAPDLWEAIRLLSESKKHLRDSFATYVQRCAVPLTVKL
jgi:hypothetical protein